MSTKFTFVIEGFEPNARSIFAVEGMNRNQRSSFEQKHKVYVCRNTEGIFFSKNLSDAHIFSDEDSACSVIDTFNSKDNLKNCEWDTVLLADGQIANNEQLLEYQKQ